MKAKSTLTLTILSLILICFFSLLRVPLIINAAKYAQVGREILDNHNWLTLTIGGTPYEQKPPMLFWIAAVCFKIFGVSIPMYKVSVILISMFGVYSTYRLGKLLYDKNEGLLAAMLWMTSLCFFHYNNDIHTDTVLVSFVVFSVWQFAEYFRNKKFYQFILGATGLGLSMLTKGPVGAIIPIAAIGAELIFHKQWKDIFNWRWALAFIIVAVIISPALIGLFRQFGLEGIKFYFWTNNVGRVTGSYHGDSNDYLFYIHTALYLLLPWTIFMLFAMFYEIKSLFGQNRKNITQCKFISTAAILVFVGILSVAKQKNPHYLLSAVPFIFIITSKWCVRFYHNVNYNKTTGIIAVSNKVVSILIFVFIPIMTMYFFHETRIWFWLVIAILAAGTLYLVTIKLNFKKQIAMLMLAFTALIFSLYVSLLPNMLTYHSAIKAAELFNEEGKPGGKINLYGNNMRTWGVLLYANNYGDFIRNEEKLETALPSNDDWFYTNSEGYEEIKAAGYDITIVKKYTQDKKVTSQSLNFLIPKSREARFRTAYLIRID